MLELLIILGIAVAYCIIVVTVPNDKEPKRCRKCGLIEGDGKAVIYKHWVEVTCKGHKEKVHA